MSRGPIGAWMRASAVSKRPPRASRFEGAVHARLAAEPERALRRTLTLQGVDQRDRPPPPPPPPIFGSFVKATSGVAVRCRGWHAHRGPFGPDQPEHRENGSGVGESRCSGSTTTDHGLGAGQGGAEAAPLGLIMHRRQTSRVFTGATCTEEEAFVAALLDQRRLPLRSCSAREARARGSLATPPPEFLDDHSFARRPPTIVTSTMARRAARAAFESLEVASFMSGPRSVHFSTKTPDG